MGLGCLSCAVQALYPHDAVSLTDGCGLIQQLCRRLHLHGTTGTTCSQSQGNIICILLIFKCLLERLHVGSYDYRLVCNRIYDAGGWDTIASICCSTSETVNSL